MLKKNEEFIFSKCVKCQLRYKKKLVYTHNTHFEKIFQNA